MKACLFSVSYAGLWGQDKLTLEDFVRKATELGYQGIEIMCKKPHLYPFDYPDEAVERLKTAVRKNGLEVACLAAYTNFTAGGESREVPLLDLQVSYVRRIGEIAQHLGVNVRSLERRVFLACSVVVGAIVSVTGLIGFVGLVVPHAIRRLVGPDHRVLLPTSLVAGAGMLVLCDMLARASFQWLGTEPPVGAVTALVGGPVFLVLLRKRGGE